MRIAILNISQEVVDRGAEVFAFELSQRLGKTHTLTILTARRKAGSRWPFLWRFYLDPHGISIFLFTLMQLPKLFLQRFDVVIPLNGGWQALLVRVITWVYGGKVIISGQSGIGWDDKVNLWTFPDIFVALTQFSVLWAKNINPLVKIKKIPNGVDVNNFTPKGGKYKHGLSKPIILCVAALTQSKGIDRVINAVSEIKDASLLIVGDGELKAKLESMGKSKLGKQFKIISVDHRQMPSIYRSADVFAFLPQSSEAFGIVYVEAMASGLAVIGPNDEARREIIGKAGILVNSQNQQEIVAGIKKVLSRKWGTIPRKQAEKFSWDSVANQYEEMLKELDAS